jgi:hypothetical protein
VAVLLLLLQLFLQVVVLEVFLAADGYDAAEEHALLVVRSGAVVIGGSVLCRLDPGVRLLGLQAGALHKLSVSAHDLARLLDLGVAVQRILYLQ